LLIDHFVPFSLTQVLVPFVSHYNNGKRLWGMPLGGIAVALGILAFYCIIMQVVTSLIWIDKRKKTWRVLHYTSYLILPFIFLHALYVGTDLKYGTFRDAWIAAGVVLVIAIIARLWRIGTVQKIKNKR
jgi:sulfoxide reductase heme-binding subunit YedZ